MESIEPTESNIIENNDTKILSTYVTSAPESTKMELTIKINKTEITPVIKDLERYEYSIVASYKEEDEAVDFLER